jgi:hypothetical protein
MDGLCSDHRDYLALGGHGFVLGDGALDYRQERIEEAYYNFALFKHLTLSSDIQLIQHTGYNRARSPARCVSLRADATWIMDHRRRASFRAPPSVIWMSIWLDGGLAA